MPWAAMSPEATVRNQLFPEQARTIAKTEGEVKVYLRTKAVLIARRTAIFV